MKKYYFWIGISFLILLSTYILRNFILKINQPIGFAYEDPSLVYFILHHYMDSIFNGNLNNLFTLPMFYGFKYSLFFTDHHLIFAFFILPLFFITHNIFFR